MLGNKVVPDRFDDLRREWIADHQGIFPMQKRRAELLNRQIRWRNRVLAGARPSASDDNVVHPLLTRRPTTFEGWAEWVIVWTTAILAPIGWPVGRLLYGHLLSFIPDRLRAYPIPALLWTGFGVGMLTVLLYTPDGSFTATVFAPYFIAQIPATFAIAGVYGILNGWIAVDGSTEWWPQTPPPVPVDLDLPLGPDDLTAPHIFLTEDDTDEAAIAPFQITQSDQPVGLVLAGLAACAIGSAWIIGAVIASVL